MAEATTHADTYHRHDDQPKGEPSQAVTGRPADVPPPNSTLADRAKAKAGAKQVGAEQVEDKAVKKAPAKKAPAKG